jgi:hypothetical protein
LVQCQSWSLLSGYVGASGVEVGTVNVYNVVDGGGAGGFASCGAVGNCALDVALNGGVN